MRATCYVLSVLLLVASTMQVRSGESANPPLSVGDFVNRFAMSRFSAYAEVCTERLPTTKGDWDLALRDISATVDRLIRDSAKSGALANLDKETIPGEAGANLLQSAEASKTELKAQVTSHDPDASCAQYFKNVKGLNYDSLKPTVTQLLSAMQEVLARLKGEHRK